jgi:hypothetical protein
VTRTTTKLAIAVLLGAALAGLAPAAVHAKGAVEAAVAGPGLGSAIVVSGPSEGPRLGELVLLSGFFAALDQSDHPLLPEPPTEVVGPRYTLTYTLRYGTLERTRSDDHIRHELYPYAKPRPVAFTSPGQPLWGGGTTVGGWFEAPARLRDLLVELGLPPTAPAETERAPWLRRLAPVLVAALALLLVTHFRERAWRVRRAR